jgi:phthalate 4,5-dioxygenase oxygenase subunit
MPSIHLRPTDYGFYYGSQRNTADGAYNWRITQWILPSNSIIPHPKYPISSRAYIPIDDENTFVFGTSFNPEAPMTQEERDYLETGLGAAPQTIPGTFTPVVNRENDYMLDRESQRAGNSTGIPGVNNQDRALFESMGPIVDRENGHLGTSDVAVIAARRKLIQLARDLADGKEPVLPHNPAMFGVRAVDVVSKNPDLDAVVETFGDQIKLPAA